MGTKRQSRSLRMSKPHNSVEYISSSESNDESPKKKKPKNSANDTSSKGGKSQKKKMQTSKSLMEKMKPTPQEMKFRKQKTRQLKSIKDIMNEFICSKCGYSFETEIKKHEPISSHPLMNVLLCSECCDYYGDGDFSLDSDDEDKYCRWCGEGGTIYSCSKCICGFCHKCITKHFGKEAVKKVKLEEDWICYFCNPKPLWHLRFICSLALKSSSKNIVNKDASSDKVCEATTSSNSDDDGDDDDDDDDWSETNKSKNKQLRNSGKMKKNKGIKHGECETVDENESEESRERISDDSEGDEPIDLDSDNSNENRRKVLSKKSKNKSSRQRYKLRKDEEMKSEDSSDDEDKTEENNKKEKTAASFESRKPQLVKKLQNILKLAEHQMSFGVSWSSNKIKQLDDPNFVKSNKKLINECRKAKWFVSSLSSYLIEFCNYLSFLEKEIHSETDSKKETRKNYENDPTSSYASIIKFLKFAMNQVNMFDEKGIELEDLLGSEIYEDDEVLGLRKTSKNTKRRKKEDGKGDDVADVSQTSKSMEENEKDLTYSPFKDHEIEEIVTILKGSDEYD